LHLAHNETTQVNEGNNVPLLTLLNLTGKVF